MSYTVREWLFDHIDEYDSKREVVLACDQQLNVGTSYIYKVLKKEKDFKFFCSLWETLHELDGHIVKKSEILKELNINNNIWNELSYIYNLNKYSIKLTKGSHKGIYIGDYDTISDLKNFLEDNAL